VDGKWQPIDPALPNTGRYDWAVPPDVTGQVSLKLTVSDLGGHAVERIYGPMPVERWLKAPGSQTPTTRPSIAVTSRPADDAVLAGPPEPLDMEKRLKARELHSQGVAHLKQGQYALAAERFREAMETDPDLIEAICGLAGVYYRQQDYSKAVDLYTTALSRDPKNVPALRGAELAYVAMKQYPQARDMLKRLVTASEKDAQAWLDLGDVLFMMGNTLDARNHWSRATAVDASAEEIIRKAKRRLESYGTTAHEGEAAGGR
jgi:tetratricopeptide (TPR) repeat protein